MEAGGRRERRERPEWLRPGSVLLVFVGGCLGAGLRELLTALIPDWGPIPVAVLTANLAGAFLLGLLLEALIRRTGAGAARARLLLGTGFLGGFTTYSALALAVTAMLIDGRPWAAIGYGVGTVLVGAVATLLGIAAGAAVARRSGPAAPSEPGGGAHG